MWRKLKQLQTEAGCSFLSFTSTTANTWLKCGWDAAVSEWANPLKSEAGQFAYVVQNTFNNQANVKVPRLQLQCKTPSTHLWHPSSKRSHNWLCCRSPVCWRSVGSKFVSDNSNCIRRFFYNSNYRLHHHKQNQNHLNQDRIHFLIWGGRTSRLHVCFDTMLLSQLKIVPKLSGDHWQRHWTYGWT